MAQSSNGSAKLSLADLRYLFAFLARDKSLFLTAKSRLDSASFDRAHEGYRICWEQTVVYYNKWEKMPTKERLQSAVIAYLDETDNTEDVVETAIEEVIELIPTITPVERRVRRSKMRRLLRQFLDSVTSRLIADRLTSGERLRDVLTDATNQSISNTTVETGRSKDWFHSFEQAVVEARVDKFETGHPLVDELTNGGPRSGEVLLHMGAVNSGKTTLAVDMAVSRAKFELRQAEKEGRKNRRVFFYCYEESRQVFAQILARSAEVASSSVQNYLETQDKSVLSSRERGDYKPYEKQWRRIGGGKIDGELERLERTFEVMKKCFRFVSMSSEDPENNDLSGQYVEGLVEHFESDLLNNKVAPDLIVIDHASAMVERYMMEHEKKNDDRRHLLKQLAMKLRDRIAAPHRIPIWCLHQLGSEENKKPPGSVPDVASGSECRMMHEFFSFALQSSRVTEPDKIGVIALGKKRRMKGADNIPFRIDGDMCRWRDARSTHTIYAGRVRDQKDIVPLTSSSSTAFTPTRRIK